MARLCGSTADDPISSCIYIYMCVPSLREGGMCRIVIKNVVWRVVSLSVICVGLAFVDIGSEEAGLSQNPIIPPLE
jgi:hypothetical protein